MATGKGATNEPPFDCPPYRPAPQLISFEATHAPAQWTAQNCGLFRQMSTIELALHRTETDGSRSIQDLT